jgi:hypothetical protein
VRGVRLESNSSLAVLICRATRMPATIARTRLRPSSIRALYGFAFCSIYRFRSSGAYPAKMLKYCPNGECVNFQLEMETGRTRCPMCAWELQSVKKQSDSVTEDAPSRKTA